MSTRQPSARPEPPVRRVAVLDDYQGVAMRSADWSPVLELAEVDVLEDSFVDEETLIATLAPYEVLCVMRERTPLPRRILEQLPTLRCVVTTGAANRSVDISAAGELGIMVSATTNGMGRIATAELTWGLILAIARRIPQEDRALRAGRWQGTVGTALHGRTLGIMGLGGIGRHVARYGRAFGMDVIAWSANLTAERALESQATRVDKEELLRRSDVVTVHTVLSPETVGLVDADALSLMKPSSLLVNTSRGPLVREDDLIAALRSGGIAGAALDVYDREPLPPGHPFLSADEVVLTPHIGYVTQEVYREFFTETVCSCASYLSGQPVRILTPLASHSPTARGYEDV